MTDDTTTGRRPRRIEPRPFPSARRLVTAALRVGRRTAPMHGLIQLDVTEARRRLELTQPPLSFTAFVVASVARAAASHPAVHAYRDWRGRLINHHHVDVSTIVEVETEDGPFPLVHMLRDADVRSVADLTAELRDVKAHPVINRKTGSTRLLALAIRIPGAVRLLYVLGSRSVRARERMGTVSVTAVGMFAGGGGFGIAPLTLMSLQVVVGGVGEQPRIVNGELQSRQVLDLTVSIDHNVVDGGPAARFGAALRTLIETAECLPAPLEEVRTPS